MDHPARTAARSSEHLGARGVGITRLGATGGGGYRTESGVSPWFSETIEVVLEGSGFQSHLWHFRLLFDHSC
jgi:hypothetical protein